MKQIWVLILILSVNLGCRQNKARNDISGNWWSIQQDSTYSELYINDSELVFNHESYGPIPRKFKSSFDSIYIYNLKDDKAGTWRIIDNSDSILILANQEEEHKFHRLNLPKSYFESYEDSLAWQSFEEAFFIRHMKKR
ncbi:hypothetical protein U3A58_00100 [Algoriphagus sp. C2-6-M1]|uniref:hypothetical protein n=1 Tax=Algoriphagus persicinus TaxID=3108754 RepID=UPI002B36E3F3|nr:hypothetical protein [Algoriphagus sp. C2-6-M1]MEB2778777.1 hypothetical protein [Algoriphagus sp. C2-6-M1]